MNNERSKPVIPVPSRSQVVLIGVSDHRDTGLPSHPALRRGVEELARLFKDPSIFGIPEANLHCLSGPDATKDRISEMLKDAAARAEDLLFVYHAGHGLLNRHSSPHRLDLAHYEAKLHDDLTWMDFPWLRRHVDESHCHARYRVLALDSCHSGSALATGALSGSHVRNWQDDDRSDLSTLITACEKREEAQVPQGATYSVFAAALIDVLTSGIDGEGDTLSADALLSAIRARIGTTQTPRSLHADGAGAAPLFWNRQRSATPLSVTGKRTIPRPLESLEGRDETVRGLLETARGRKRAGTPFVAVVHGRGGAGKSAIVHQVASELGTDFPDWQLYLNLHTWTPNQPRRDSAGVLEELLYQTRQTNFPNDLAARAGRWRSWLADNSALIVLDDVADADQVKEVLPPADSSCVLLISSRSDLADLKADELVEAGPLDAGGAARLLTRDGDRETDPYEIAALVEAVSGNPKALDLIRSQLKHIPPDLLLEQIKTVGSGALEHLYRDAAARLDAASRATLNACGFHPGPDFDARSIAAIRDEEPAAIAEHLHRLGTYRLIKPLPHFRFQLHDEDARIAAAMAESDEPTGRAAARDRLIRWMRRTVEAATMEIWGCETESEARVRSTTFTGPGAASRWLNAAIDELTACCIEAVGLEHADAAELTGEFTDWLGMIGRYDAALVLLNRLNRTASPYAKARARLGLARAAQGRSLWREATAHSEAAIDLAVANQFTRVEGKATLALAYTSRMLGKPDISERHYRRTADLAEASGNQNLQARSLQGLGEIARGAGDLDRADQCFKGALDVAERLRNRVLQANSQRALGTVARKQRRFEDAIRHYEAALSMARSLGNPTVQAVALCGLGQTAEQQGRTADAIEIYSQAIEYASRSESRSTEGQSYLGVGRVHAGQGRTGHAGEAIQKALGIFQSIGLEHWVRRCLEELKKLE